jgi:hypothetical protein
MGKYINENSKGQLIGATYYEKINALVEDGAIKIDPPKDFTENLVCVVHNGYFGAIGYAYDEREMNAFIDGTGDRKAQWFIYDHAKKLAV